MKSAPILVIIKQKSRCAAHLLADAAIDSIAAGTWNGTLSKD
jgi:hypothetical protein